MSETINECHVQTISAEVARVHADWYNEFKLKRLKTCGLAVAGLVCLAATVPAASLTIAPATTGHIEDGLHASSSVAMDAGWHASPGEDKHSALFRFARPGQKKIFLRVHLDPQHSAILKEETKMIAQLHRFLGAERRIGIIVLRLRF